MDHEKQRPSNDEQHIIGFSTRDPDTILLLSTPDLTQLELARN